MSPLAMGHGAHASLPLAAVLDGVAVSAIVLWPLLFRHRTIGASGPSEHERQTLSGEGADLVAMLRQKGGPMTQPEICEKPLGRARGLSVPRFEPTIFADIPGFEPAILTGRGHRDCSRFGCTTLRGRKEIRRMASGGKAGR